MTPDPARLLAPLLRAVQRDKPVPDQWRAPLVELVMLLIADPDALTSARACRVIIEMEAANMRREQRQRETEAHVSETWPTS